MNTLKIAILLALTLSTVWANTNEINAVLPDHVIQAMIQRESSGRNGIVVMDTNKLRSYGVLQIQLPYLKDANRFMGTKYTLEDVRTKPEIAKKVVKGYVWGWSKYHQKRTKKPLTLKQKIALHNGGGPQGHKVKAALSYASEVLIASANFVQKKTPKGKKTA